MKQDPKCLLQTRDVVGESPIWHPLEKALFWVDIFGKKIHRFTPSTAEHHCYQLDQIVTSIAQCGDGKFLIGLQKELAFFDPLIGTYQVIQTVENETHDNRFNEGKCDRQGRFWAGTINAIEWNKPSGSLYRLNSDLTVDRVLTDVICSNGIGWSPDSSVMYFTESFRYTIFAYDFDAKTGNVSNKRIFVSLDPKSKGFPDGLTVDSEGYVWSAMCGLGQIVRYTPDGKIDDIFQFPVPRVTSCCFGGEDYTTLYVTSALETMTPEQIQQWPLSGSLFSLKVNSRGIAETPFNNHHSTYR